jgi:ubiquilin
MNSPLMESLLSDPELLREMMLSNPTVRNLVESNPELGQALSDPDTIRRAMEMSRNPNLMREMMRNTDRQMSNIEGMPGGFDALRRMYTDVQQPLEDSMFNPTSPSSTTNNNNTSSTTSSTNDNINTNPLPNPWGGSSNNTTNNTSSSTSKDSLLILPQTLLPPSIHLEVWVVPI